MQGHDEGCVMNISIAFCWMSFLVVLSSCCDVSSAKKCMVCSMELPMNSSLHDLFKVLKRFGSLEGAASRGTKSPVKVGKYGTTLR